MRRSMMAPTAKITFVSLLRFPFIAVLLGFAQIIDVAAQDAVITGRVVDAETRLPLPGVNVFLDQTTRGAATSEDGSYEISALRPGSYRVIASMVGYGMQSREIEIRPGKEEYSANFELRIKVVTLGEVEIGDKRPVRWRRNLKRFEKAFLGSSRNARKSAILNPYVLDFQSQDGTFQAKASAPIEIENRSLGYHLTIVLTYFHESGRDVISGGPVYFRELAPSDEREAERWRKNRERTYRGSFMHLMRSLVQGTSRQQGFFVAHEIPPGPYSYNPMRRVELGLIPFLEAGDQPYLYNLFFENSLYVEFGRETSWLRLNKPAAILHEDGYLVTSDYEKPPMRVLGGMSNRRVADMLPRDYGMP